MSCSITSITVAQAKCWFERLNFLSRSQRLQIVVCRATYDSPDHQPNDVNMLTDRVVCVSQWCNLQPGQWVMPTVLNSRLDPGDAEFHPKLGQFHGKPVNGDDLSATFGGLKLAADAGWDGCTLPVGPEPKAWTMIDVSRKFPNIKMSSRKRRRNRPVGRAAQKARGIDMDEAEARPRIG